MQVGETILATIKQKPYQSKIFENHILLSPVYLYCVITMYVLFFSNYQRTSNRGMSTASTLAQSCAILALAQLTPLIITIDSTIIYQMIDTMTTGLPGQPTAAESSVIQMHHGIGLGWVLRSLNEERFTDVSGNEVHIPFHNPN